MRKTPPHSSNTSAIRIVVREELKRARLTTVADKVDNLEKRMDEMTDASKIIRDNKENLERMDEIAEAARIIRENEQNLKDLGGLKHRLDVLDKIYVKVDKIAGEVITYREEQQLNSKTLSNHDDRIEKLEKHAGFPRPML